jgi:hypothetical protein
MTPSHGKCGDLGFALWTTNPAAKPLPWKPVSRRGPEVLGRAWLPHCHFSNVGHCVISADSSSLRFQSLWSEVRGSSELFQFGVRDPGGFGWGRGIKELSINIAAMPRKYSVLVSRIWQLHSEMHPCLRKGNEECVLASIYIHIKRKEPEPISHKQRGYSRCSWSLRPRPLRD